MLDTPRTSGSKYPDFVDTYAELDEQAGYHRLPQTDRRIRRLYSIGADEPVPLMRFVEVLERELGIEAEKRYPPLQTGDVPETHLAITDLARDTGYRPQVSVEEGVRRFVEWYRWYYQA